MKRVPSGELDGSLQPSEKAAKEGDAVPQSVGADPLLELLRDLSLEDANEWLAVLHGRRVRSLDALKRLARDAGWEGFLKKVRDADQDVLASELNAWKQGLSESFGGNSPGKHFFFAQLALALPLLDFTSPLV